MAIWLFRAGSNGEYEKKFLDDGRAYITWDNLNVNLKTMQSKEDLAQCLMNLYNDNSVNRMRNYASQIWPAVNTIKKGDWVVLPSKLSSTIHIGEVKSDYQYDKIAENPYYHWRDINWFATDIPRQNFDQDLLYSFGAFMTICKIQRNDAEKRIKQMAENEWKTTTRIQGALDDSSADDIDTQTQYDLEETSNDVIAKYIIRKYKGHGMAKLVEEILKAKGYTTYSSPAGPDEGVDILAAKGELGFEDPILWYRSRRVILQ